MSKETPHPELKEPDPPLYPATPSPTGSRSQKKRMGSVSGMGISISSFTANKASEPVPEDPEKEITGSQLFSEEELLAAWNAYAGNLTEEKLLKNTMTLYRPKMISDVVFEVEVNTELNRQYLTDNSLSILSFLREQLSNSEITMMIRIA